MATIEERFRAAVNVIKGLPKNGPYQPSTTMMLMFYGYYKQATEGPCHQRKPAFWDVIGKAKWDAWNTNRHLSREQAMNKYVEELRQIIETMSFTENVQNFVGSISGLGAINLDELEMIAPGMRELAESHPDSPFNSRTNSPQHGQSANSAKTNGGEHYAGALNGEPLANGDAGTPSASAEQDTSTSSAAHLPMPPYSSVVMSNGAMDQSDDEYGDPVDMNHELTEAIVQNSDLVKQVQATVARMNDDLAAVNQRMFALERTINELRASLQRTKGGGRALRAYPNWWPMENISPGWFLLLILWPFVVKRLSRLMVTPRRQ